MTEPRESALLTALAGERTLLGRSSTAERVSGVLRERIIEGSLPPGLRLSEDVISQALGVSRNTLREAFRLLAHERLLVHELNRGVFVRRLTPEDLTDLFRIRRMIELGAVQSVGVIPPDQLTALRAAVDQAREAATEDRWGDVGTANMRFHQSIAHLAGSPRIAEVMDQVLAELRLVFHVMADPQRFHEPYIERNAEILRLLEAGATAASVEALAGYLDDAEEQLLAAM